MFNRGVAELLRSLPDFEGLDSALARRWLTSAYSETLDLRAEEDAERQELATDLGRLSTALQLHALMASRIEPETRRACAFVAAEALSLIDELVKDEEPLTGISTTLDRVRYRRLESGLLYLIAGYDSNAGAMARQLEVREPQGEGSLSDQHVTASLEWAIAALRGMLLLRPQDAPEAPSGSGEVPLENMVLAELWRRLGAAANAHLNWLRLEDNEHSSPAPVALDELLGPLVEEQASAYSQVAHLARLLRDAVQETTGRAMRGVPVPDPLGGWNEYRLARARERPLLWPAAADYARRCLPGPQRHAAVAVPTGAGKSGVAELAISQAVSSGWVLYLAPTNALVAQVQRDLRDALESVVGIEVRGFIGGAELVDAAEEVISEVAARQVLVMTPEKCSLALRQAPEAFASLALCVLDECHLIADRGNRGVLAELVMAHVLFLSPDVRVLLLSALMQNPEDLAGWLQTSTGHQAIPVRDPWRPTRTLRTVLGFDNARGDVAAEDAVAVLQTHPKRKRCQFDAPVSLLAGLQGAWDGTDRQDYALVPTSMTTSLAVVRHEVGDESLHLDSSGYVNPAVTSVAGVLARQGHRVLAFLPRNRHYSFSVGANTNLSDITRAAVPQEALAQLDIADAELGLPSAVRALLDQGVGVHTSAMLVAERRASEIAFDRGSARVMFATGTLAQGLNLPATAVIIGGTEIGHDPTLTSAQRAERTRAQLLNALGRSGRPGVAARSLAIVVPNRAVTFGKGWTVTDALAQAPFLANEDAADAVVSRLDALIDRALRRDLEVEGMSIEELAAFAVLPLEGEGAEPGEIVRRSYGAWQRNAANEASARVIAGSLVTWGERFLGDRPRWLAEAAYRAGLTVQQILALHDAYLETRPEFLPSRPQDWVALAVTSASRMSPGQVEGIISDDAVASTRLATIYNRQPDPRAEGWARLHEVANAWMEGETYEQLAVLVVGPEASGHPERHQQAPLPRVIRVIDDAFVYGLSRLVGGLVALHQAGTAVDASTWTLTESQARSLGIAPMAIRSGCGPEAALAWHRFAVRPRRLAHLFAARFPPPTDADDATQRAGIESAHDLWLVTAGEEDWGLTGFDLAALRAWRSLRID